MLAASRVARDALVCGTKNVPFPAYVRGSYSARVPRSSVAGVHREFVHQIREDEVDGQEERQDDKREDGEQREENGVAEESQNRHMRMTHDARTTNTRLEPSMCE